MGRGRQNKHTHTCADEFLFKNREGGEADTMHRRSSIPPPTTLPHLCPPSIAAPSLTAKRHRDATEAERSSQTGPPPCCKPHWGSPLCLSLPSYHLHPLAALQPPRLSTSAAHHSRRQQQQKKTSTMFPVVSDPSCVPDAACLASSAHVEAASPALELPPSVLWVFHSLLDCFFLFLFFIKVDINVYVLIFRFLFSLMSVFVLICGDMS